MDTLRQWGGRGLHTGLSTLSGFQKFILRGNVVDLAVGVVIGAAFTSVVNGAVTDLLQPLIGMYVHISSFDNFHQGPFLTGKFIGVLITFLLTAAVVYFFVVKPVTAFQDRMERLQPKKEESPMTRECPFCLSTVNIKATRCAYCTAQLPPADQPAPAGAS
jgi:large conductance mechanosensitive channel